jgi:hypothetical protein
VAICAATTAAGRSQPAKRHCTFGRRIREPVSKRKSGICLGLRLDQNTQLYFDPEIAGGRGFSRVKGIADSLTANCLGWRARRQSPI